MSVFCLSFHGSYRCAHSGVCCTSGWAIPVERAVQERLDAALNDCTLRLPEPPQPGVGHSSSFAIEPSVGQAGRSPFVPGHRLPDGSSILRVEAGGACACYDVGGRRCSLHAQLGHDALPVACQHFPRVCLVDRDGIFVTLSHYCPTAARLLFAPAKLELRPAPIAVVSAPPSFAPMTLEGLDAREALPPLLRPRMLADRDSYRRWERWLVETFGSDTTPESALAAVIDVSEALRRWEPREGPLFDAVDWACIARRRECLPVSPALTSAAVSLDGIVRRSVPAGLSAPLAPVGAGQLYRELVAPEWIGFAAPVRRYLAAKAFANWCAYQGRGLRTVVCFLVAALSVLRTEAVRHCVAAGRRLDETLLFLAFESADLLLVHLAAREELARALSGIEEGERGNFGKA